MSYNQESTNAFIQQLFEKSLIPSLSDFIRIPNLSRDFDPEYKTNGLLQKAGLHVKQWVDSLGIKGLKSQFLQPQDLTPLLLVQIDGEIQDKTILFYGHFDKQPHSTGWDQNKGPTTPVIQNNRLYGRGSVDDGFSAYTYMLAIKTLQEQGIPLPRIIILHEGDEESGNHIVTYLERLKERLGNIDIVFILDADIADYQRFWLSRSIRGSLNFLLKIKILKDGVHSGDSSGIVPSAFKIANQLISRLQNIQTGQVHSFFQQDIPADRYQQFYQCAKDVGMSQFGHLKTVKGLQTVSKNPLDVLLNRGWKPTLTVTGLSGLPPTASAGNVMLPQITLKVSIRLPPTFKTDKAQSFLNQLLTTNTPFGAAVTLEDYSDGQGWNSKPYEPWLQEAIKTSVKEVFGSQPYAIAEGGSIPVVGYLSKSWPNANVIVSGAVGPNANAHGPNEFLDLPYALKLTKAIASIVAKASEHFSHK